MMRPTAQEERALRAHFGNARYERLHNLALKRPISRALRAPEGRVVVIHGIMGSELTAFDRAGAGDQIWQKALRLLTGQIEKLRLTDDGYLEYDPKYEVRASGILKRYYGELQLKLATNWTVQAFWYDWRKDLDLAAKELRAKILEWFDQGTPVHIVAHSMGGLVARTFIKNYPELWESMWDKKSNGKSGGRLIMLGTPNHGSFDIPQVVTGIEPTVRLLEKVDYHHNLNELLTILNSFVGSYQMLPSPLILPEIAPLYHSNTYGTLKVSQRHLDNALNHHKNLSDVIDLDRMIYVAGCNQITYSNIADWSKLDSRDGYETTLKGDGRVSHQLGFLKTPDGKQVKTYYIETSHGDLSMNEIVLDSLEDLLKTGATTMLYDKFPTSRAAQIESRASKNAAEAKIVAQQSKDEKRVEAIARRMSTRGVRPELNPYLTADERELEQLLVRGFLGHSEKEAPAMQENAIPFEPAFIEIALVKGKIEDLETLGKSVDAIAVGHYVGVKPVAAVKALDQAISRALPGKIAEANGKLHEADLLITQYTERGIIRGELGQPFFLLDPRAKSGKNQRIIAIAGMGLAGRFGGPELAVLARELCWSLGRLGKHHLASVLIGAGKGNLSIPDAISAWMRGLTSALTGSSEDDKRRLNRITFVEFDPRRIELIQESILDQKEQLKDKLKISYKALDQAYLDKLREEGMQLNIRDWKAQRGAARATDSSVPIRIMVELANKRYRYGAITETASVPEREVPLDPDLVMEANDELAAARVELDQLEKGRFLERLLIPADLRSLLVTKAPIVMMLDATTARIHWEMMAQSDQLSGSDNGTFLGKSRGFTRQLRTEFAPPPEPPPPTRRILRVLVVADPAEDAPLPGAQMEGAEVAKLFESFNEVYQGLTENRVEVVTMFGPRDATRTKVLGELMRQSYDVLHYAGHCFYDEKNPPSSGWIFTGGKTLSANELNRIDRIPKFVFSNACESGITPDRAEMRAAGLAPSFAEAFFERGVSNFVCTAWPVDDNEALKFAVAVYSNLLGISKSEGDEGRYVHKAPEPMYVAMREARGQVASTSNGARTWGAYQHYGNPYFRFFDNATLMRRSSPVSATYKAEASHSRNRSKAKKTKRRSQ